MEDVEIFLDSIEIPSERNLTSMKQIDWTKKKGIKERSSIYSVHNFFAQRAAANANELYNLVGGDLSNGRVKSIMELLYSTYKLHTDRITNFVNENDWSQSIELVNGEVPQKVLDEGEFQTSILKDSSTLKNTMSKVSISEDNRQINIKTFKDVPLSLALRTVVESKLPEIGEFLEKKKALLGVKGKRKK